MKKLSERLRLFKDCTILNIFFLFNNKSLEIKKDYNLEEKQEYILIELQFHNILISLFYVNFCKLFLNKYNIIFFYYNKLDYRFNNYIFKIILFSYLNFLKKNFNAEIINFYKESSQNYYAKLNNLLLKIKNSKDVNNLKYKGVNIGKLIFQSYCREIPSETVDVKDERLKKFILEAIILAESLIYFFKKYNIKKIFISHSIFIKYGLVCRIGNQIRKSKIYILHPTSPQGYLRQISLLRIFPPNFLQIESYCKFKEDFKLFKNKKKRIELGKRDLENRMYKNKISKRLMIGDRNPYDKKNIIKIKSTKPKVIIIASCFFDAVNFYKHSLYTDSYIFVNEILKIAKNTNFEWYIKPHPDGQVPNSQTLNKIKKKFPFLKILNSSVSNITFKKNNFKAMFTFNGSAVHEFIAMGIPSFATSDNKQAAYEFGKCVKSKEILKKLVMSADKIKNNFNISDIYEFNYMYSFQKSKDWKNVKFLTKKEEIEFLKLKQNQGDQYTLKILNYIQNKIFEKNSSIKSFVNKL